MSEQLRRIGYIRISPTDRHLNVLADCTELRTADGNVDLR